MTQFKEIRYILAEHRQDIRQRFSVREIGIFGSFVRGEHKKTSDIDVLVTFLPGRKNFDNYMGLKLYLEDLLRHKIDLVIKETLRKELKPRIMPQVVYV